MNRGLERAIAGWTLGACLLTTAPFAGAADTVTWPQWRGSGSDGRIATGRVFPDSFHLRVRWRTEVGTGYSGVVVDEGLAVTMASDGRDDALCALDAVTGREVWRVVLGPTFAGREGAVDGPVSTPAIAAGAAFGLGPRGDLVAVDLEDGAIRWRTHLVVSLGAETPHWGFTTSPLVVGKLLVVLTGGRDGRIATAFDLEDGTPVWSAGSDAGAINYQSPLLATLGGRRQVVAASDTTLFGIDPDDGTELWRHVHGGERFYARIINPVVVDEERLLMTLRPDEAEMIRVTRGADGYQVAVDWTTESFKRNYATPIQHDGSLFGLGGSLLSCVDAANGQLRWQSRRGGDSWPIVVDDHVVTLTKSGELVVVRASPDAFEERAAVPMFERLVWTPPSFAYGRIYGRDSFGQVASVDIVEGPDPSARAVAPETPKSAFATWVAGLDGAPDREARIRRFLDETTFPLIEGSRTVHLVYHGKADTLAVSGDMLATREQRTMDRVPGIDGQELFFASFELEPDARVNYQFVRDLTETLADPLNPRTSRSLFYAGEVSRLLMPQATDPAIERVVEADERVEEIDLEHGPVQVGAMTWEGERKVGVYLPPGYADGDERYPTVYVLYGLRMLEYGNFDVDLDARIEAGSMRPAIVVFVGVMSAYEYARSQRGVHGRMLVEELVPRIDATYRTRATAESRAVVGGDEGGYAAIEAALRYPHVFGNVSVQSIRPIGAGGRQLLDTIELLPELPVRVALDWGRYDMRDPRNGTDVADFSRRLAAALAENRYDVDARESDDGPDFRIWTVRALAALERWFP